jgi:squalene synthase HpnD
MNTLAVPVTPSDAASATAAKASGSSFYAAMRLMPKAERRGMFAIYAFCRIVDDIADADDRPRGERRAELDGWAADLHAFYAGARPSRLAFLAEAIERFALPKEDFLAVIDGMLMDVDANIVAPGQAVLDLYCDRVAVAVGRLSVHTFAMSPDAGTAVAHHLGRALQLTNIVRDVDEDAAIGRLYLPAELLAEAGVPVGEPRAMALHPGIDMVCRRLAATAQAHFDEARRILRERPGGRLRTPRLMAEVYAHLLGRMQAESWAAPRRRIRIGKRNLLWLVVRHGLIG